MRIALVTQEEPFYLPPALDTFCAARQADICALIILPAFNETLVDTARRLYEFYGPVDFVRLALRYCGAKLADKVNRLRPFTQPYSAADVATRYGLSVYRPTKINAKTFITRLQDEIKPDLVVSVAASQIFKKGVLAIPPLGCINLHSAPLPRYQGMMPNFWTLVHGEPEASVTVHYMVEKLDAGDIILRRSVPIHPNDSLHALMIRSKEVGIQALLEAVDQIEQGLVQAQPMDSAQGSYFSFPKRRDARRLRQMGHALL